MHKVILTLLLCVVFITPASQAAVELTYKFKTYQVEATKTKNYIHTGLFKGGDSSITSVRLKDIRRAQSNGYERIVLDLASVEKGALKQVPYFEVRVVPNEGRFILSIWSDVKYDFNKESVQKSFVKSTRVKKLNIIPQVEDGLTTIEFIVNHPKKIKLEAFRLSDPARIILDIL